MQPPGSEKTAQFFRLQSGVPTADHASETVSRKAKRLDTGERRGILARA
jgi:hypothetical protein